MLGNKHESMSPLNPVVFAKCVLSAGPWMGCSTTGGQESELRGLALSVTQARRGKGGWKEGN